MEQQSNREHLPGAHMNKQCLLGPRNVEVQARRKGESTHMLDAGFVIPEQHYKQLSEVAFVTGNVRHQQVFAQ